MENNVAVYFHIATILNYQNIFDEIFASIKKSDLLEVADINLCVVGNETFGYENHPNVLVHKHPHVEAGEFFTLQKIKELSNSSQNRKILYVHTKGVTTPNNECIDEWRQYMTYFNVEKWKLCYDILEEADACGVDLVEQPTKHFSGNFWWANSNYIKTLPSIETISSPDFPSALSTRHNAEFWIGMGNGKLVSMWDSGIDVYKRHLSRYPSILYKQEQE